MVQQRGLAATGLALDHQNRAGAGARVIEQPVDVGQLGRPPVQHEPNLATRLVMG
jgi:hypothetical protein